MKTGTGQRNQRMPNEPIVQEQTPGSVADSAESTQLPVPRVDEDDYAPTIIRGRE